MKMVIGVFRGFPGLGRVSAGIALLKELQHRGFEVAAISYYQGIEAIIQQEIPVLFDYAIEKCDITSIGINPITGFATTIIREILKKNPDVVIIDGEPLLQSTLSEVFPKERIVALLNPSDLKNEFLPESTIRFYHKNYLSCGNAIVHGIDIDYDVIDENKCKVHYIPTILRQEVLELKSVMRKSERVVGILGGGSINASEHFFASTVGLGKKMVSVAQKMNDTLFDIYCNDVNIKEAIGRAVTIPSNVRIESSYVSPQIMYKNAGVVIARSGRNVVSELLFLNIGGILFATDGDYRSKEQEKNIDAMVFASNDLFVKIKISDCDEKLIQNIGERMNSKYHGIDFEPGNQYAISIISKLMEK